jgi:hypothetical protein
VTGPANPLSWQSAFFGLISLAFNAMMQPSGLDQTFSQSSLIFPSRSSPIICLADALEILIEFVVHLIQGRGPSEAGLRLNWRRVKYRLGSNIQTIEDIPAEKHPKTFVILLIGTLLQAIKLFAVQGIFWTKVWAGIYLASYLLVAASVYLPPRDWRNKRPLGYSPGETPPKVDKSLDILSNFLFILALVVHYTICSWAVYKLFLLLKIFVTKLPPESFGYNVFIYFPVIVGPGSIMGVFVFKLDQSFVRGFRKLLVSLLLKAYISFVLIPTMLPISCQPEFLPDFTGINGVLVLGGGILLLYFIILVLIIRVLSLLFEKISFLRQYKPELNTHCLLIMFASSNFLVLFLYYHSVYNSSETVKPTWAENLG